MTIADNLNEAENRANESRAKSTNTAKDAANRSVSAATDIASTMKDSSTAAYRDATEETETMVADTQKNMTEQLEKFSKGFEGFTAFGQENMDALVKSSEIAAKAAEGIGSEVSAYSKKTFEDSVAAAQDIASAKSMTELFEKQTAFAQAALEGFMHQSTKMNEILVAASKEITAPMSARVTAATDKMKTFAL